MAISNTKLLLDDTELTISYTELSVDDTKLAVLYTAWLVNDMEGGFLYLDERGWNVYSRDMDAKKIVLGINI